MTRADASWESLSSLILPLSVDVLKEFIHRCADEICGRRGPTEDKFCTSCSWTHSQFQEAVASSKAFLTECVVFSHSRDKIKELLSLLDDPQINGITNCLTVREEELQKCLLNRYQNHSAVVLHDFDWKLKWLMGSSSLAALQEVIVELDLITVLNTGLEVSSTSSKKPSRIILELTHENVNTLIHVLEKAQVSL